MNTKIKLLLSICSTIMALISFIGCDLPAHDGTAQKEILNELGVQKAIIVNGDDMGLNSAVNNGITNAWYGNGGIVSSASIQATSDDETFNEAVRRIKMNPYMDIGVHVTLASTNGMKIRPVSNKEDVQSLVDEDGYFFEKNDLLYASMDLLEVETEVRAQVDKVKNEGIKISHINSHFGTLDGWPAVNGENELFSLYLDIVADYDASLRWFFDYRDNRLKKRRLLSGTSFKTITDTEISPDDLDSTFAEKKKNFINMLNNLKYGITEILCHPADEVVEGHHWRYIDYRLVTDPDIIDLVNEKVRNKELAVIGFKTLKAEMLK